MKVRAEYVMKDGQRVRVMRPKDAKAFLALTSAALHDPERLESVFQGHEHVFVGFLGKPTKEDLVPKPVRDAYGRLRGYQASGAPIYDGHGKRLGYCQEGDSFVTLKAGS